MHVGFDLCLIANFIVYCVIAYTYIGTVLYCMS